MTAHTQLKCNKRWPVSLPLEPAAFSVKTTLQTRNRKVTSPHSTPMSLTRQVIFQWIQCLFSFHLFLVFIWYVRVEVCKKDFTNDIPHLRWTRNKILISGDLLKHWSWLSYFRMEYCSGSIPAASCSFVSQSQSQFHIFQLQSWSKSAAVQLIYISTS